MFWQQDLKLEMVGGKAVMGGLRLSNPTLGNLSA